MGTQPPLALQAVLAGLRFWRSSSKLIRNTTFPRVFVWSHNKTSSAENVSRKTVLFVRYLL